MAVSTVKTLKPSWKTIIISNETDGALSVTYSLEIMIAFFRWKGNSNTIENKNKSFSIPNGITPLEETNVPTKSDSPGYMNVRTDKTIRLVLPTEAWTGATAVVPLK